jgi:hypothetical protein
MTTKFEDELRATFHERAAEIPDDAIRRVTATDYRPRRRRTLSRPVTALTGGVALAAAGAGTTIALLGSASPAFAGWSATPTAPTPGQLQQAASDCQQQTPFPNLPLKLADTRGPFTFEIYADDQSDAICIHGPSFTNASGMSSSAPFSLPADRIQLQGSHTALASGAEYWFALGRAGSDVRGVTFDLSDGSQVQATVQNGWFVAWWPGDASIKDASLATGSGTQTQTFPQLNSAKALAERKAAVSSPLGTSTGPSTTSTGPSTTGTPGPGATYGFNAISGGARHASVSSYSSTGQSVK